MQFLREQNAIKTETFKHTTLFLLNTHGARAVLVAVTIATKVWKECFRHVYSVCMYEKDISVVSRYLHQELSQRERITVAF